MGESSGTFGASVESEYSRKRNRDAYRCFLVDKDTMMLAELFWVGNFVRLGDSNPQNPLRWWSTKINYRFNCGERFSCKSNILF